MIVPDINLLLYAYDSSFPVHSTASAWWQTCLSGTEPVGLPDVVALGFVRLATHLRVFSDPMAPEEAAGHVRSWLEQPPVQFLEANLDHLRLTLQLLETIGTAGNLVTGARIAAMARDSQAVVHTADSDFLRFPGLRWHNPLTGAEPGGSEARGLRPECQS